jgi:hypothetical protein
MNDEQLLTAIKLRGANLATRTDYAERHPREIGYPASLEAINAAEEQMGCTLHPFHRRLFQEVGNGGFGPGDGLIGIPGGSLDVDGRSIVDLRKTLFPDFCGAATFRSIPICDWGDGIWSCVECDTGRVLSMSEFGLMDTGDNFQYWLEEWVSGVNLWRRMVVVEETQMQKPQTSEWILVQVVKGMRGVPLCFGGPAITVTQLR